MLEKEHLTPSEIAVHLGVWRHSVYRWLYAGRLRGLKVGHNWRVSPSQLAEFLAGRTVETAEQQEPAP